MEKASFYIHIPYCISKCSYCDFYSVRCGKTLVPDNFVDALCSEIKYRIKKYDVSSIDTLYIGGGTPSLLKENQLIKIFSVFRDKSLALSDSEVTIETNPDDINVNLLDLYSKVGINRISCGIQTMNEKSLEYVFRRADTNANLNALNVLKDNWKKNISIDLICGLPFETVETFTKTIQTVCDYTPDHISMYSLTFEKNTPLCSALDEGKIDYDFDFSDELWLYSRKILEKKGYEQYEVSNFAKQGFECSHNMKYWNHQSYIGCGSGATGTFYNEDGCGVRWTNTKNLKKYIDVWNNFSENAFIKTDDIERDVETVETIDIRTSIFEFFMMGMRKLSGISSVQFKKIFGQNLPKSFVCAAKKWQKKGLCDVLNIDQDVVYRLNSEGILFLNSFLEEI